MRVQKVYSQQLLWSFIVWSILTHQGIYIKSNTTTSVRLPPRPAGAPSNPSTLPRPWSLNPGCLPPPPTTSPSTPPSVGFSVIGLKRSTNSEPHFQTPNSYWNCVGPMALMQTLPMPPHNFYTTWPPGPTVVSNIVFLPAVPSRILLPLPLLGFSVPTPMVLGAPSGFGRSFISPTFALVWISWFSVGLATVSYTHLTLPTKRIV